MLQEPRRQTAPPPPVAAQLRAPHRDAHRSASSPSLIGDRFKRRQAVVKRVGRVDYKEHPVRHFIWNALARPGTSSIFSISYYVIFIFVPINNIQTKPIFRIQFEKQKTPNIRYVLSHNINNIGVQGMQCKMYKK